jgi:hypothetical protein
MTTDVLTAVSNGIRGLWTVAPCSWVGRSQFRRNLPLPSSRHSFYMVTFSRDRKEMEEGEKEAKEDK